MNISETELMRRRRLLTEWQSSRTLERDEDGTWHLVYSDGATIELGTDPSEPKGFIVQIGNTYASFYTRHAAEWHLWDNWSECNHL